MNRVVRREQFGCDDWWRWERWRHNVKTFLFISKWRFLEKTEPSLGDILGATKIEKLLRQLVLCTPWHVWIRSCKPLSATRRTGPGTPQRPGGINTPRWAYCLAFGCLCPRTYTSTTHFISVLLKRGGGLRSHWRPLGFSFSARPPLSPQALDSQIPCSRTP